MRRLLGVLRRSDEEMAFAPQPSLTALDALVTAVREAGLPVALEIVGEPVALPPGVDLGAYRIVQEALTNALKHAGRRGRASSSATPPTRSSSRSSDDGAGVAGAPGDAGTGWSGCASASRCTAATSRPGACARAAGRCVRGCPLGAA